MEEILLIIRQECEAAKLCAWPSFPSEDDFFPGHDDALAKVARPASREEKRGCGHSGGVTGKFVT